MLDIKLGDEGQIILSGRLDASQEKQARQVFDTLEKSTLVDLKGLEYISSAGLGVLLKTQKRLMASGGGLQLVNVNPHINDILRYSGLNQIFEIQTIPESG